MRGIFFLLLSAISMTSVEAEARALRVSPMAATILQNDMVTMTASGGMAPYSFFISRGAGNLINCKSPTCSFHSDSVTGPVDIRVRDSKGVKIYVSIQVNPPLRAESSLSELKPGQAAMIVAHGGVPPYSFFLSSGEGNLVVQPDKVSASFTALHQQASSDIRVRDSRGTRFYINIVTQTPTPSPSPSASAPVPTPILEPSPSATPSPTPKPTPTPMPTPRPTATPSPSVSPSPSVMPTPTPSPTPNPSPTLNPSPSILPTPTPSPMPTPKPTPTPMPTPTVGPSTPTPSPKPTPTPVPQTHSAIREAIAAGKCIANYQMGRLKGYRCNDLTYDPLDSAKPRDDLKLDLYLPSNANALTPLIVWVHGGGWVLGTRRYDPKHGSWDCSSNVQRIAGEGYVLACITYRLAPSRNAKMDVWYSDTDREDVPTAIYPAQLTDVKTSIQWLRQNADNLFDINRVGAWGDSAGGHLVSLLGFSDGIEELKGRGDPNISSSVQAVADFYGVNDLELHIRQGGNGVDGALLVGNDALTANQVLQIDMRLRNLANPMDMVWKAINPPPFMIAHGTVDTTVKVTHSQHLRDAMLARGFTHRYFELPTANHSDPQFFTDPFYQQIIRFFNETLKN